MDIKFLGTGGAFDYEYGNSSAYLRFRGKRILLDCGHAVYPRLRAYGLADEIDYILLTHLHDDHVGSLATTILHHIYVRQAATKAKIIYPSEAMKQEIHDFLSFGFRRVSEKVDFVSIDEIPGLRAVESTGKHVPDMLSFSYIFEDDEMQVGYSGDLGEPDHLFPHLDSASEKRVIVFHEIGFERMDGVHTYYKDLEPYLNQYEIYGYHTHPDRVAADNRIPLVMDHPEFLWPAS
ncbi:MAG: MBL fold metallo-hydrolase [Bacteroidota bacterium]